VFIPRSAIGREELPLGLKDLGAIIKSVPVYNVAIPLGDNVKTSLQQFKFFRYWSVCYFTSPSTFENFLQIANLKNPFQYSVGLMLQLSGQQPKKQLNQEK